MYRIFKLSRAHCLTFTEFSINISLVNVKMIVFLDIYIVIVVCNLPIRNVE